MSPRLTGRLILAMSALLVIAGLLLILGGCAWSSNTRTQTNDRSRIQGTAGGLPVDVIVERQVVAQEQASGETSAPALAAMASSAASGVMSGGPIGGLIGLAAGAFAAWKAASGTVKTLKDQVEYHKKDADEGWTKADERALKLPPQSMEDRS